ncbi:uncharacterized protein [Argopecten irradians]|uniref:uncharacterized protein n=1 Tax=Argopecten irradians TaxID=31199 RepID=UPI003717B3D3
MPCMMSSWLARIMCSGIALCCIIPSTQPMCAPDDSCVSFPGREYCEAGIDAGSYKPPCPVMEVEIGEPRFIWVYIPCCNSHYNVTSRRWYFSQNARTWEQLSLVNETLLFYKIRKYQLGYYRCVTSNGNQTTQLIEKECIDNCDRPEVKVSEDTRYVTPRQHTVMFMYHINFGCQAISRHISITYRSLHRGTTIVPHVVEQGCERPLMWSCGGNITLSVNSSTELEITITATACYGGKEQTVSRSVKILNGVQYIKNCDNLLVTVVPPLIAVVAIILLATSIIVYWKLHVVLWSRMTCLLSKTDTRTVFICHCDEDEPTARSLKRWMTDTYGSLRVVCSYKLTGKGILTGEIDNIKESDIVIFIPNYLTPEKVNDNLFNSIVEHKQYYRITILDTGVTHNTPCSLTKNKLFRRLKHIDMSRENFRCELQRRLPPCIQMCDNDDSSLGSYFEPHGTVYKHDDYQSGYHTHCKNTFGFLYRHFQTCNRYQSEGELHCEDRYNIKSKTSWKRGSDVETETNLQQSNNHLLNNLKLIVPIRTQSSVETKAPSSESPDTAMTCVSPDVQEIPNFSL